MKREVTHTEENGVFAISCPTCPLIPLLKRLGKEHLKHENCIAGMVTNMQGHMVIHQCRHYTKDSILNGDNKTLWIECTEGGDQ